MKLFVAILFFVCPFTPFLSGTNSSTNPPVNSPENPVHVEDDDYEGVIFPAEDAENYGIWVREGIDAYWTPSPEDIARMEAELPGFIEANEDEFRRDIDDELEDYVRQYAGYESQGQRWIYINAICNHGRDFDDWESNWVFVDDGGDCFFQLSYNFDLGEFSNLSVNGDA